MKIVIPNVNPLLIERLLNVILDSLVYDPKLPILYNSHIRYRNDPGEVWQDPHLTAELGYADCEDLSLYRALELRGHGYPAACKVYRAAPRMMHVIVDRLDGRYEDPSRMLGMNAHSRVGEDAVQVAPGQMVMPADFRMATKLLANPEGAANDAALMATMAAVNAVVPGGGLAVQLLASPEGRMLLKQLKSSSVAKKLKFW